MDLRDHVVAAGGSEAHSASAIGHLKAHGVVAVLQVAFEELPRRAKDSGTRGIARAHEQPWHLATNLAGGALRQRGRS